MIKHAHVTLYKVMHGNLQNSLWPLGIVEYRSLIISSLNHIKMTKPRNKRGELRELREDEEEKATFFDKTSHEVYVP